MNTCHENTHHHFSLWVVRNSVKKACLVHKGKNFLWVLILEQATLQYQEQISTVKVHAQAYSLKK